MTEMKDKIYPTLPTIREQPSAPDIVNGGADDRGHSYRLQVINSVQKFLEEEITNGTRLVKNILEYRKLLIWWTTL